MHLFVFSFVYFFFGWFFPGNVIAYSPSGFLGSLYNFAGATADLIWYSVSYVSTSFSQLFFSDTSDTTVSSVEEPKYTDDLSVLVNPIENWLDFREMRRDIRFVFTDTDPSDLILYYRYIRAGDLLTQRDDLDTESGMDYQDLTTDVPPTAFAPNAPPSADNALNQDQWFNVGGNPHIRARAIVRPDQDFDDRINVDPAEVVRNVWFPGRHNGFTDTIYSGSFHDWIDFICNWISTWW